MGNSLDGFSEKVEPPIVNKPLTDKDTERGYMTKMSSDKYAAGGGEPSDIRFAVSSMQGWRATMEDTHILASSLTISSKNKSENVSNVLMDHALFCVFDGHGGGFTSEYASKHFLRVFTDRPELSKYLDLTRSERKEVPGIKLLKAALTAAFLDIDTELKYLHKKRIEMYGRTNPAMMSRGRSRNKKKGTNTSQDDRDSNSTPRDGGPDVQRIMVDRSGSTAVMVLLTPHHVICCNAGDSRAILCRDGDALPLSFDHKPSNPTEFNRVKESGGFVRYKRIDGDLAVSRGLGDFRFKLNDKVEYEKQKVSIVPELIVCPRDNAKDQFLVVGCDGIWDVMENQDCAEVVQSAMDDGEKDLGNLCEYMLDTCLERQSKDNMTICVISLPACTMEM